MKSPLTSRNKIIAITLMNLCILGYLGWLLWTLQQPKKIIPASKSSATLIPTETLVAQILAPNTAADRLAKIAQIPPTATLDQIKPLAVTWRIDWNGYQTMKELEKVQSLAQINALFLRTPGGKVLMAQGMASLLSQEKQSILIRNRAYFDLCNAWVTLDQEIRQARQTQTQTPLDPKVTSLLPQWQKEQKEQKELTILFKQVTSILDQANDHPLLPLRIQAKAYFAKQSPQDFDPKALEQELLLLQKQFSREERIQIEILKALLTLSSPRGIENAIAIVNSPSSSESSIKTAIAYLREQKSTKVQETLAKKQFPFPDLEEERLKALERFKTP